MCVYTAENDVNTQTYSSRLNEKKHVCPIKSLVPLMPERAISNSLAISCFRVKIIHGNQHCNVVLLVHVLLVVKRDSEWDNRIS